MDYGKSEFYQGKKGETYFSAQNQGGSAHGDMDSWKFAEWISEGDSVLDFGCGAGWMLKSLQAGHRTGVELNPAAIEACRGNGIEVFPDLSALPPGRTFSRIISHHCLEHIPYPIEALRSLRERLSDDGRMIIVVPIDDWRVQRDFTGCDKDHHLHTWTPRLLANTLAEAGFECERCDVLTNAWPWRWQMFHRVLPRWAFQWLCGLWAVAMKRRQLRVVARKSRKISGPA